MAARKVAQMEVLRAGRSVVRMVVWTEVLRVVRMVDRMAGHSEDRMGAQKADRLEDRKVVPRVDRMEERLEGSGRMAEPVEVLLRLQVGVVGVKQRFPLRVRGVLQVVLPEPRARALPA